MTETIKITQTVNFEEIDKFYLRLDEFIRQEYIVNIHLPKIIKNPYIGLVPALLQFACTWIRYENSGKLILDIDKNASSDEIDKLYDNELIFPLISMVWNKNEVYDRTGTKNMRGVLKNKNIDVYEKIKRVEIFKGWKLPLMNFDHLPPEKGILPVFGSSIEFKDEDSIKKSLKPAIDNILNYGKWWPANYKNELNELIAIVYELMKNTFEWGKTDKNNVPLDPNIRGLLIKFYKNKRINLLEDFKNHKGVNDYFKNDRLKESSTGDLYFLEISVVDSGIGFVERFKSYNTACDLSNVDIVKTCMIKHITSAKGLEKDDKGIGLDRILKTLNHKGFLRIKTGNVCLYRNLISHPYKEIEKGDYTKMELFDWSKNSNTNYKKEFNAQGTVISIVFPLSN